MKTKFIILIIISLLILILFFLLKKCEKDQPLVQGETQDQCIDRVSKAVVSWRAEGKTNMEIEKLFQEKLAKCSGSDDGMACLAGTANFDYARLGRQLLSDNLEPAKYLAGVRDRSRKLRAARADSSWGAGCIKGDKDGDLVPDDRDKCEDTGDLIPTDDFGCPDGKPLPAAPSVTDVKKAKDVLKIAITPACNNAPIPTFSEPLQIGLNKSDENIFLIAVTKVTNQPKGCMVFYEVNIVIKNSSFFSGTAKVNSAHFVFRPSDNIEKSITSSRQIFPIRKANFAHWDDLVTIPVEPSDQSVRVIRVRATNGNGISSGWSSPKDFSLNLSNQFFED